MTWDCFAENDRPAFPYMGIPHNNTQEGPMTHTPDLHFPPQIWPHQIGTRTKPPCPVPGNGAFQLRAGWV